MIDTPEVTEPRLSFVPKPTLYTKFSGQWCDNCRTAYSYRPASGNCPDCGTIPLRSATITVEPDDVDAVIQ